MKTKAFLLLSVALAACAPRATLIASPQFPAVQVPAGYHIEKMVGDLTYPTSVAWDDQGRMYVLEAGGAFNDEASPARILRVENGGATEVVNLKPKGLMASAVGLAWYQGAFYVTHRAMDGTDAVSRVTPDGQVTQLFSGIGDGRSEHQINDIRVGPDGRMYVAVGPAGNSAVMGIDNAPFVKMYPDAHTSTCQDIVLTGRNFETPDFRTPDQNDKARTGAFVPFGTETTPGQVIKGTNKCGGAILAFDPANPEASLKPYAWGLRNVIGMAWNRQGEMLAAVNGYDIRGSRPVKDKYDATYRIRPGAWYGWPGLCCLNWPQGRRRAGVV